MGKIQDSEFAVGGVLLKAAARYLKVVLMVGAGLYIYQQFAGHRSKPVTPAAVEQPAVPEKPPVWRLEPKPMWQFEVPAGQPVAPPSPRSKLVV